MYAYIFLSILAAAALRGEERGGAEDGEDEPTLPLFLENICKISLVFGCICTDLFT